MFCLGECQNRCFVYEGCKAVSYDPGSQECRFTMNKITEQTSGTRINAVHSPGSSFTLKFGKYVRC